MGRVFIAYASEDLGNVQTIKSIVEQAGHVPVSADEFVKGTPVNETAVLSDIRHSDCLVLILSEAAAVDPWVKTAVMEAQSAGKQIIPMIKGLEVAAITSSWARAMAQELHCIRFENNVQTSTQHQLRESLQWVFSDGRLAKVVAFVNFKGGVGKTSLCAAVASCFVPRLQKSLLVIDLDPQENLSDLMLTPAQQDHALKQGHTALSLFEPARIVDQVDESFDFKYSVHLLNDEGVEFSHVPTRAGADMLGQGVSVIPSDERMIKFSRASSLVQDMYELNFKKSLRKLSKLYDVIFIDCGPAASLLSQVALQYSHRIIAPVRANYSAVRGLHAMRRAALNLFETDIDKKTHPAINFFQPNSVAENQFAEALQMDPDMLSSTISFIHGQTLDARIPLTNGMINVQTYIRNAVESNFDRVEFGAATEQLQLMAEEVHDLCFGEQ